MYGEWLRVTPAELERALADLDWAHSHALATREAEQDSVPPGQIVSAQAIQSWRSFGTDKSWNALMFLLDRVGFPLNIVVGEHDTVADPADSEVDWGFGPPRYLAPDQVRVAASALAKLDGVSLITDGDRRGELTWAIADLPNIQAYFAAAAEAGDAVLCWIN
jgi:hypothetical protein